MDSKPQNDNAANAAVPHDAGGGPPPLTDSIVGGLLRVGSSQPSGGPWQPPSPEELQRQFPQYEIRGILGRGGMGAVYKGWQKSLRRFVAIKILPPGIDDGGMDFAERFKQEARAMAKFRHPGIVAVHDAGETPEGVLYFIMECIEGKDVAQLVAQRGRLQPAEALRIAGRVCEAVAYAHERGVIHRDIKPSNVMIEADGAVKVADFGVAKLSSAESTVNTLSSVQIGSLDFMPPEALHGSGNADHRADIYAVGGMLYQMLTGKAPHGRFEPPSVAVPGLDKRFDAIVDKAMHADAAKRYSTATELHAELARIAGTQDVIRPSGRPGTKAVFAILLVTAIVGIAAIIFAQWRKNHTGLPSGDPNVSVDTEGTEPDILAAAAIRRDWAQVFPDLAKLSGITEFKDGWAQMSDKERIQHLADPDGRALMIHNGGIRVQRRIPERWQGGILLHARSMEGGHRVNLCYYGPKAPGEKAHLQLRQFRPETLPPNATPAEVWAAQKLLVEERIPPASGEITTDLTIVGSTVRGRLGDHSITATVEDSAQVGRLALDEANTLFFRDVAVLNLDSLTEAEALKSAGMKTNPGQVTSGDTARWRDAFAESPLKEVIAKSEHTAQGYRLPGNNHWAISPQPVRSGAVRVRATSGGGKFLSLYVAHDGRLADRIRFHDGNRQWMLSHGVIGSEDADFTAKRGPFPLDGKPHELLLARIGGFLRVMVDGQPIFDEADPNATLGSFVLDIFPCANISAEKVEYLELDGVPEMEARKMIGLGVGEKQIQQNGVTANAPEPRAIRLWDSAEQLPKEQGIRWENNAVRLDGHPLRYTAILSRDAIVRAEVRMNPDEVSAQVGLRYRPAANVSDSFYLVEVNARENFAVLSSDHLGKRTKLHMWSLPRAYGPEEWLRLELRTIGDEVTVIADGQTLGAVRDTSLPEPGGVHFFATSGGYFRNIAYFPLDEPSQSRSSPSPVTATKDAPFVNSLGMGFVPVPITGGPTDGQRVLFSVWDTRVQDYETFAKETKRERPKLDFQPGPTHPAVNVSWEDAVLFCQWLTAREQAAGRLQAGWRYRLPSDHEWSCAVELGEREDPAELPFQKHSKIDDVFPWGTPWPPPKGAGNYAGEEMRPALAAGKFNYIRDVIAGYNDGFVNTSPVGSFAANRFGLFDLGGNAWQWCEDWFDQDRKERVLRGASWHYHDRATLLSSNRGHNLPGDRYNGNGFRCVLAPVAVGLPAH